MKLIAVTHNNKPVGIVGRKGDVNKTEKLKKKTCVSIT